MGFIPLQTAPFNFYSYRLHQSIRELSILLE